LKTPGSLGGSGRMIDRGKRNLLGVGISAVDYEYAVAKIMDAAKKGHRCATTALAVHGVITGAMDSAHRYRLNTFDLVTPDGQPVRWGLNLLHGTKLNDRVYGPTMTLKVCQQAALQGIPVYFYGSSQAVLDQLCARLPELCPGLKIAGAHPSQFRLLSAEEQVLAAERISQSGAKILFVGLGCPRQEVFTYEMSKHLSMPMLAVGAAFDYHAGLLQEPPRVLQRYGLQWLYRLCQEPRRLWRRYLFTNSQFLGLFLAQWLRLWRPQLKDCEPPLTEVRVG
jgi:N-acetylglucosaminyldiphosphoundecaprenol N-acetyl-beta-D-mannosaminyltransferase